MPSVARLPFLIAVVGLPNFLALGVFPGREIMGR